jgi:hypothetical protein
MRVFSLLSLFTVIFITGCASDSMTDDTADRIAGSAWMIGREIPAASYSLTAYERMHERFEPANIYIEGDSQAWFAKINLDADPQNPVALNLAAHDKAQNVGYIARPCQYSEKLSGNGCDHEEWKEDRFSQEIINAYGQALDNIKAHYDITEFNLVGFSGGAAIATILAAKRDDVASLKTVAGIMDHAAFTNHHNMAPLTGSLNPVDYAAQLKTMPQNHFVGGNDDVVPFSILGSYLQAVGASDCVQYNLVQEAEHQEGWVDKWPVLEKTALPCSKSIGTESASPSISSNYRDFETASEENLILQAPIYRVPRQIGDKP